MTVQSSPLFPEQGAPDVDKWKDRGANIKRAHEKGFLSFFCSLGWNNVLVEPSSGRPQEEDHQDISSGDYCSYIQRDQFRQVASPFKHASFIYIYNKYSFSSIQCRNSVYTPYFKRLVIEDEGRNQRENDWTKPLSRQLLQCLGFETLETQMFINIAHLLSSS